MNVPGSNVLSIALRALKPQEMQHAAFTGRTINATGDFVSTYAAPVTISGSMQAVNKALYSKLGLNFARNYAILYTSVDVKPTATDRAGDKIIWSGKTWLCESDHDWRSADGWRKLLCVEI